MLELKVLFSMVVFTHFSTRKGTWLYRCYLRVHVLAMLYSARSTQGDTFSARSIVLTYSDISLQLLTNSPAMYFLVLSSTYVVVRLKKLAIENLTALQSFEPDFLLCSQLLCEFILMVVVWATILFVTHHGIATTTATVVNSVQKVSSNNLYPRLETNPAIVFSSSHTSSRRESKIASTTFFCKAIRYHCGV